MPAHFYGEVEEFAWVPVWSVIPITAGSLPRFGKSCNEGDGSILYCIQNVAFVRKAMALA